MGEPQGTPTVVEHAQRAVRRCKVGVRVEMDHREALRPVVVNQGHHRGDLCAVLTTDDHRHGARVERMDRDTTATAQLTYE